MNKNKTNIVLIGMPGSGKSTVGVILAKMLAKSFLDTDILIQNSTNRTLQNIDIPILQSPARSAARIRCVQQLSSCFQNS